jgi:hypothetical protein
MTTSDAAMSDVLRSARGPVVALVDDGPEHSTALWAAVAEALRSGRTLQLLSSDDAPTSNSRKPVSPILQAMGVGEALARKRLEAAAKDVHLLHPELTVQLTLAHAGAVRGLRAAATAGSTVVLDRPGSSAPRQAGHSRWTRLLGRADLLLCGPHGDVATGPVAAVVAGFPGDQIAVRRAIELGQSTGSPVLLAPLRGSSSGLEPVFAALDAEPNVELTVLDAGRSLNAGLTAVAQSGARHVVLPANRRLWAVRAVKACPAPVLEFPAN